MEKVRIGIVGSGFGSNFIRLMHMHPDVEKVVAADYNIKRCRECCEPLGISCYESMDEMLSQNPDLNAVGIWTPRHTHGPLIIDALKKGLHVFSAVPIAVDIDQMHEIISLVEKTRLTCMIAETCYYFPDAMYCREEYKKGTFGKFVFGQAAYYHDISEFVNLEQQEKGIPPMFYPTHSMSMLFGAIDDYPVDVCCFGATDPIEDAGIYGPGNNLWDNPFANEIAMFHMSKGGIACIHECRRIGKNKPSSVITCLSGTKSTYNTAGRMSGMDFGELPHLGQHAHFEDVSDQVTPLYFQQDQGKTAPYLTHPMYTGGYAKCQNTERLPKAFRDLQNHEEMIQGEVLMHNGSHPLLVDDFVRAVLSGKLPPNHVWASANYMAPGLIAHKSALAGGVPMKIPYFGEPPADWKMLDYTERTYDD